MTQNENLNSALLLMQEHVKTIQREFGHIYSGKNLIANNVSYPSSPGETQKVRNGVKTILEGAMLIYLLSMWESHMPTDVHEWLSIGEKRRLNAYKHVRDSAAHKYNGERAKNHNNKVQAFESEMPFSNIIWDQNSDTIDLSNSSISYDFYQYMDNLIKSLIVRFYKNEKPSASKKS